MGTRPRKDDAHDHRNRLAAYVPDGETTTQKEVGLAVADELRKLAALRDEGLLTTAEFEAHRERLLKR